MGLLFATAILSAAVAAGRMLRTVVVDDCAVYVRGTCHDDDLTARASGEVTDVTRSGYTYTASIAFETPGGPVEGLVSWEPDTGPDLAMGDEVELVYDPRNPADRVTTVALLTAARDRKARAEAASDTGLSGWLAGGSALAILPVLLATWRWARQAPAPERRRAPAGAVPWRAGYGYPPVPGPGPAAGYGYSYPGYGYPPGTLPPLSGPPAGTSAPGYGVPGPGSPAGPPTAPVTPPPRVSRPPDTPPPPE
ncbi:MAG: hypothetical protein P8Z68_09200 [Kineosporiaceae bacterium]